MPSELGHGHLVHLSSHCWLCVPLLCNRIHVVNKRDQLYQINARILWDARGTGLFQGAVTLSWADLSKPQAALPQHTTKASTGLRQLHTRAQAWKRSTQIHMPWAEQIPNSPMADIHLILEAQLEQMPLPHSLGTQHYPTLLPETLPTSYAPWRYAATAGTLGSKNKCHFKSSFCKAALETPEDHCRIPAHSASTPHPTSTHHRHHSKASNPAERSSAEGRRKNAGKAQSSRWMDWHNQKGFNSSLICS